jgi:hypothetical protein
MPTAHTAVGSGAMIIFGICFQWRNGHLWIIVIHRAVGNCAGGISPALRKTLRCLKCCRDKQQNIDFSLFFYVNYESKTLSAFSIGAMNFHARVRN